MDNSKNFKHISNGVKKTFKVLLITAFIASCIDVAGESAEKADFTVLSDIHGKGQVAKYITNNEAFNWNGQLGIDWDILRYSRYIGYLSVNIETIIEGTGTELSFNPDYIRYMLEPGIRIEREKYSISLIYHHICRHDIDRFDKSTEKWNLVGLRIKSKPHTYQDFRPEIEWLLSPYGEVSFGRHVVRNHVTYEWDGIVEVGADILKYRNFVFYIEGNTHLVTQEEERPSGKKYFIDVTIEPGVKFFGKKGNTLLFTQYRHEHDVDMYNGTTEDWWLVGVGYEW